MPKETPQPVGPELAIDMNYAMTAHVAPAMAVYVADNGGRLDTAKMRRDLRAAVDGLDAAAGRDDKAWLEAAKGAAAIGNLLTWMRVRDGQG